MSKKGYLILENGNIFTGISFGSEKEVSGEVVFNTGMVGYPESLTDPSYSGQILTMTYPLVGNYGVPSLTSSSSLTQYLESDRIQIRGLIVSSYIDSLDHWQAKMTLAEWLKKEKIPALKDIDTRFLTQLIRERGVLKGVIVYDKSKIQKGFSFEARDTVNLVKEASCTKPLIYGRGKFRILLIDCGLKQSQIRVLLKLNTTIIRVPWNYDPFAQNNKFQFDAILVSNGPGDPKEVKETIDIVRRAIERRVPILGICLGSQILALAAGADTYKLKYGHRGENQPVKEELTNKCFITTQNHGFAVDTKTLAAGWNPWFSNLNDSTNEGIRHAVYPFLGVQFHPEATPGPTDTKWLFSYFLQKAKEWLKKN